MDKPREMVRFPRYDEMTHVGPTVAELRKVRDQVRAHAMKPGDVHDLGGGRSMLMLTNGDLAIAIPAGEVGFMDGTNFITVPVTNNEEVRIDPRIHVTKVHLRWAPTRLLWIYFDRATSPDEETMILHRRDDGSWDWTTS